VTVADVNGDGKWDLVVAVASGTTGGTVSVLLGNGDGTFQSHVDYSLGQGPISILTADFNGDGKLDIAAANNGASTASILLGNGDGTFQGQVTYYVAYLEPTGLVAGDFNGDGHPDLAVVNDNDNTICILFGKGDGTFPTSWNYEYGGSGFGVSFGITAADFLNRGAVDLAVANFGGGYGNTISVLLNSSIAANFPPTLSFAPLAVGTSSPSQQFQLMNPGSAPLTIGSIATTGDFSETNACGTTLAVGANCSIDVTFTPTAPLNRIGTVVMSNSSLNAPESLPLTGTGIGPAIAFSPSSLNFSGQLIGNTSTAQTITLSNAGNATLQIVAIGISGDFAQKNQCGSSLAAGASCSVTVTFTPSAGGARGGALTINDNAPGSPHTVALSGTGTDFTIAAAAGSSGSATVSAGGTATFNLTITPEGGLSGTVTLACSGVPSEAQCSISPTSIKLDGSTAVNTAITVSTTAASQVVPREVPPSTPFNLRSRPPQIWFLALLVLCSSAAIIVCLPRRQYPRTLSLSFAILLLSVGFTSCGGSGSTTVHNSGTPPGSYSLSVTATFSSGSVNLQHSVELKLTVN
jgi:FG-GAP-like repeat